MWYLKNRTDLQNKGIALFMPHMKWHKIWNVKNNARIAAFYPSPEQVNKNESVIYMLPKIVPLKNSCCT